LKNDPRAIKRKKFMKNFRDCAEICDSACSARFYALIQKLGFRVSQLQRGNTGEDSFANRESTDCQKSRIVYFFNRSRRSRFSRSARFEN
jgi:hypothetical protein